MTVHLVQQISILKQTQSILTGHSPNSDRMTGTVWLISNVRYIVFHNHWT